jgi:hypothetical protein
MNGPGKCRELWGCICLDRSSQIVIVVCTREEDGLAERPHSGTADEDFVQVG